ncbi:C40 family peptidase [Streptomyces sp. 6-11-2]|uniref:C40 family peptidase n=1 Tax=Streptomyces sp. 6-11-2 TaxID=2585753 RepID=UPI0011437C1D|nr:C40 family peptidase [Streptomyces sp. 6-11-2]
MSGRVPRLVCTAAVAAQAAFVPVAAVATPEPQQPGQRSVAQLLTDLHTLYRQAEQATETYNSTAEQLKRQRTEADRIDADLGAARLALSDSRAKAARLALLQYQGSGTGLSPYLRLLLAPDPQHALAEGELIGQLARERAETVDRLTGDEKKAADLAHEARKAVDTRLVLARRQQQARDDVQGRLRDVEKLLASLSAEQVTALARRETNGITAAQSPFLASGVLSGARTPSPEGDEAVRYAVRQLGKPYQWGAVGPRAYDCSGLTSQAWEHAGTPIPRTSQEQWARLKHIPLGALRPGDLVVYFPQATHVALYLGDGMVVQAPRPGARVKVSPVAANPVLGAVRPDPGGEPLRWYTPPRLPEGALAGPDASLYTADASETSAR